MTRPDTKDIFAMKPGIFSWFRDQAYDFVYYEIGAGLVFVGDLFRGPLGYSKSLHRQTDKAQARTPEDDEVAEAASAPLELPTEVDADTKAKPKRKPLPDHLPRVEQVLSLDDACTDCGGALRELGRDTTDELQYVPGRFVVNQIIRPRMACRDCDCISQAPMPSRPIEKGIPVQGSWPMC